MFKYRKKKIWQNCLGFSVGYKLIKSKKFFIVAQKVNEHLDFNLKGHMLKGSALKWSVQIKRVIYSAADQSISGILCSIPGSNPGKL